MKTLYGIDFGIFPNTDEDCTYKFIEMFNGNKRDTTFILEKGTYLFSSECSIKEDYPISNTTHTNPRSLSLLMKGMDRIIFSGNDSQFVFEGQTIPFTVTNSRNIKIQDISIDWGTPLSAEGIIVAATNEFVDVEIDEGKYPYALEDEWLWFLGQKWKSRFFGFCEFDRTTKKVAYDSGDKFNSHAQEKIGNGIVRFHGTFERIPCTGNIMLIRHNERLHPGIFINDSEEVELENICIYNTGGLGALAQFSKDLSFKNIRFLPNSQKGRRILNGHADGIHLSNNRGHISIDACWFFGLLDDPVNVHGTNVKVLEKIDENTVKCNFAHRQSIGFDLWGRSGDDVSFIFNETMHSYGSGEVDSFVLENETDMVIRFKEKLPLQLKVGDVLENIRNTPSISITNSFFGSCRARGVLVSTPKAVIIEKNVFESAGSAILIAGDGNKWFESGACNDVLIKGNYFSDACLTSVYQFCEAIISICPEIPKPEKDKPFHRNIRIIENTFRPFDFPVIYAFSVENLDFSSNQIIRSNVYEPFHNNKHMINLNYCKAVRIARNLYVGNVLGKDIRLHETDLEEIELLPENDLEIVN